MKSRTIKEYYLLCNAVIDKVLANSVDDIGYDLTDKVEGTNFNIGEGLSSFFRWKPKTETEIKAQKDIENTLYSFGVTRQRCDEKVQQKQFETPDETAQKPEAIASQQQPNPNDEKIKLEKIRNKYLHWTTIISPQAIAQLYLSDQQSKSVNGRPSEIRAGDRFSENREVFCTTLETLRSCGELDSRTLMPIGTLEADMLSRADFTRSITRS